MGDLLLNPNGRLAKRRFWQGLVVLTVISVLIVGAQARVATWVGFLSLPLLYGYVCVYGKRLHDMGTTAWWVLGIAAASLVVNTILTGLLEPFFTTPEVASLREQMVDRLTSNDIAGFNEGAQRLSELLMWLNIATTIISTAIIGFFMGRFPTQPADNRHGPFAS